MTGPRRTQPEHPAPVTAGTPGRASRVLRGVLAWLLALAAIPLVNALGGALSDRVPGLGGGGALRLSVDLAWLAVAGCVAAALLARVVASARRVHVLAFFAIYFGAALYAVVTAWQVFPRWFLLAVLLSVPLQAGFGMRLARPRR